MWDTVVALGHGAAQSSAPALAINRRDCCSSQRLGIKLNFSVLETCCAHCITTPRRSTDATESISWVRMTLLSTGCFIGGAEENLIRNKMH